MSVSTRSERSLASSKCELMKCHDNLQKEICNTNEMQHVMPSNSVLMFVWISAINYQLSSTENGQAS